MKSVRPILESLSSQRWFGCLVFSSIASLGACDSGDVHQRFGFHAEYDLPKVRPDDWCGTNNGGWRNCPWTDGPHAELAAWDLGLLAQDSLRWFEASSDADRWKGNETARLDLTFPSDARDITVQYSGGGIPAWEAELHSWLDRFPPRGNGRPSKDEGDHDWTVQFGTHGSVSGVAPSDVASVEVMKQILSGEWPTAGDRATSCKLGVTIRRSSHVTDCCSVEDEPARVEDLPRRLREKCEIAGRLYERVVETRSATSPSR